MDKSSLATKKITEIESYSFSDGIHYINTQQWIFAYTVFSNLFYNTKHKPIALLFNMALCHYQAKEFSKAFGLLSLTMNQLTAPSSVNQVSYSIPNELLKLEYETNQHHFPMLESTGLLHPNIIKLRIRRLLVDVHLELHNWQEIIRLCNFPDMDKCKNTIHALSLAKTTRNN